MTTHHLIDYRVIVRQINTDFFGNATPDQPHFESAVRELLNKYKSLCHSRVLRR